MIHRLFFEKDVRLNGAPLLVGMNLADGHLRINHERIFLGGYINCNGPDVTRANSSLTLVYRTDLHTTLLDHISRLTHLTGLSVQEEKQSLSGIFTDNLELYFPSYAKLAL